MKRLLLSVLLAAIASAQTDQARFTGTVSDSTGAVIAGANVKIINTKTNQERSVGTSEKGVFFAPGLLPSSYQLVASAPGFEPKKVDGLELQIGQVRTVNFVLQAAGVATEVTVSAGGLAEIDTSSARIGVNVSSREVKELPMNGRQISQLYLMAPGAQTAGGGTYDNIRFSGRANQQNAVRFDGIEGSSIIDSSPGNLNGQTSSSFRLQASLETVQEFRVESSNYPAEYGNGTAGQISIVTKSGGNQIHGSLFEYVRNNVFDARNYFDGSTKSPLRLNQFGGSVGGAIIKDKLFYFGSFETLKQRASFPLVGQTPSAAARARAVPEIRPLLGAFPIGTRPTSNPDFDIAQIDGVSKVDEYAETVRLDYNISDKYRAYVRWSRDDGKSGAPYDVSGSAFASKALFQNIVASVQQTLAPTVINETKLGYNGPKTRTNGVFPTIAGADISDKTINITGSTVLVGIGGQGVGAGISIPSGQVRSSSATNGRGQPYTNYSLSFIDNLSWIKGNHNYKFGGEFRLMRMYTDRLGGTTYAFTNLDAFLNNNPSSIAVNGDLSSPSPFNNGATGNRFGKNSLFSIYAQDEWKFNPELTISYGLRYEYYTPMREDRNLVVLYNIVTGGLDAPGSREFYKTSKLNFAPRLSLSYAPKMLKGNTVVRVGAGYFYGQGQGEDLIQPIESDRVSFNAPAGSKYPFDSATAIKNFNINTATGIGVRAYAPGYTVPEKVLTYTASVQQTLPGQAVLTVAYVGSQGRNLFLRSIANKVTGVTMNATTGVGTAVREFGTRFGEIDYKTTGGTDHYDSMQTSLNRRFSTGFTLGGQWTWSHSIGNTGGSNEANTAANPYNFKDDRGNNNFDIRHSMNFTALYELPFGRGRKFLRDGSRLTDVLVGGWDVGGILNARTGLPLDLRITRPDIVYVNQATGQVFNNPVLVGGVPVTVPVVNVPGGGNSRNVRRPDYIAGVNPLLQNPTDKTFYLNPAAFTTPKPGTFGNLGRNAIHGPGLSQFDLTLSKKVRLTETVNVQFRAEAYNLFNKGNFNVPSVALANVLGTGTNQLQPGQAYSFANAGAFGRITNTVENVVGLGAQRQLQLALRINF